jgi:hypothetical protein
MWKQTSCSLRELNFVHLTAFQTFLTHFQRRSEALQHEQRKDVLGITLDAAGGEVAALSRRY